MNEIIAIAIITLLAVISPGADFALVSRNSYLYGRKQGIYTAYGIACAVWIHISYSVLGLSFLKHYISEPIAYHSVYWCAVPDVYRVQNIYPTAN